MISRIIWKLNADKTIQKVTKLTNKLFANGQASAEYCLLADNILPTDVVTATITRDTHTTQYRLKYQLLNLEDGTSKYGWAVTSNGDELNFDLQTGTASLIFAFEVKVYSTIGGDLISSYTTQSDTATVYPGSAYSPKVEATDADKIFQDLAEKDVQIEELQRNKQDKTDSNLQTSDKTVVGAINETYSLANTNANKTQDNTTKIEQIRTDLQNGTLKPLNSTNADNYSENGTIASKFNEKQNEKPNGVDSLIVNDKLNSKYIPAGLGGGLVYAGTFDATGTITASEYVPELQGTLITDIDLENSTSLFFQYNGQTTYTLGDLELNFGDQIICNGDIEPNWTKIDNSDKVTSVNGQVGAVSITPENIEAVRSLLEAQAPAYDSRIEVKPSLESTSIIKEPTFDVDIDYVSAGGSNRTRMSVTKEGLTFKNRNNNEYYKPKINENTIAYESDIPTMEAILTKLPSYKSSFELNMAFKGSGGTGQKGQIGIVPSSNFIVQWGDGSATYYKDEVDVIEHAYAEEKVYTVTIYGDWKGIDTNGKGYNPSSYNGSYIDNIVYDKNITEIPNMALCNTIEWSKITLTDSIKTISKGTTGFSPRLILNKIPTDATYIRGNIKPIDYIINADINGTYTEYPFTGTGTGSLIIFNDNTKITRFSGPVGQSQSYQYIALIFAKRIDFVTALSANVFSDSSLDRIEVQPYFLRQAKTKTNFTVVADIIYPIGGNYSETITIPSTAWDSETKTATVEAVGATSEARNLIIPSVQGNNDNNVRCTAQGTMTLTFTCDTVPTEDTVVDVSYILTNKNV